MRRSSIVVSLALLLTATALAQNSTRKERPAPGPLAAKVGTAIAWRDDVETAIAESKRTNKPVFWFVPTVARSPMDRKVVIERYLLGGPFSWPSTIALLEREFIPVREVPRGELQKRYELVRQSFIEPGYLVLDGAGEVQLRVDQLTTFHPQWFEAPLRRHVGKTEAGFPGAPALQDLWGAYGRGALAQVIEDAGPLLAADPAPAVGSELGWLQGAALFRTGRPDAARTLWRETAARYPEEPLSWKAMLEAEGHGPFVHGFEDYLDVPPEVFAQDPTDGTRAPAGVYDESELWQRSVRFLLAMDDGRGVVRDSTYDFGGTDSLPNVYAATTCLVGMALLAADDRRAAGDLELDGATTKRLHGMLDRIRGQAESAQWLALSDSDELVWARAYAVRFLAAWAARRDADRDAVVPHLQRGAGALLAMQPETGSWFHEYRNPFATATALQALHDARAIGCEVDDERIQRGLASLVKNRTEEGAFTYGDTRPGRKARASLQGAAGRMPLCELALFLFGASDDDKLAAAVAAGQEHHALLAAVRKYDNHADRYGYGGFFFWFDMLGRAEAAVRLADAEQKARTCAAIRDLVLALPEFDGCFVDSHELARSYGTAMALLVLDVLARA